MKFPAQRFLAPVIGSILLASGWWFPGGAWCAVSGFLAAWAFTHALLSETPTRRYMPFYMGGVVTNCAGFYWLYSTISVFGGFSFYAALPIFGLFLVLSAVQFLIVVLVVNNLPKRLERWALITPIGWVTAEVLSVRIFPWCIGHTQLGFTALAQVADISGVHLISFLVFWFSETLYRQTLKSDHGWRLAIPWAVFLLAILYGGIRMQQFRKPEGPVQDVVLVQPNIGVFDKHTRELFHENWRKHVKLSMPRIDAGTLLVWPESSIMLFISTTLEHATEHPRLPRWTKPIATLLGTMMIDEAERRYNSALGIQPNGDLTEPYHKLVLMPFGEYTPFGDLIPALREMTLIADLSKGPGMKVLPFNFEDEDGTARVAKVAPLICYEDILPRLAREGTRMGANLLANLTNDAWFGKSVEPYQHHLIASFRAIENRRFLLRATNTGLTAVVDPLGKTVYQLPIYEPGTIRSTIVLMEDTSPYVWLLGEYPWWGFALICACVIVGRKVIQSVRGT